MNQNEKHPCTDKKRRQVCTLAGGLFHCVLHITARDVCISERRSCGASSGGKCPALCLRRWTFSVSRARSRGVTADVGCARSREARVAFASGPRGGLRLVNSGIERIGGTERESSEADLRVAGALYAGIRKWPLQAAAPGPVQPAAPSILRVHRFADGSRRMSFLALFLNATRGRRL